ncbi:unnamed protein product [Diatraea saccharalis]|uniref:Elongator complex protein 5 n=1 Tax=Diatraea saccharalis TaxID=40085 RepID=A0A9N9R7X9_9NEOP|nr:unnamed protein product [Diatraea saccharalis]
MTLFKLKAAPIILIEDNENTNSIPLIQELFIQEKSKLHIFCYEQSISLWENVFRSHPHTIYHEELNANFLEKHTNENITIFIDSVNQMSVHSGWNNCFKIIQKLLTISNVNKLVLTLHTDCLHLSSKLRINLNHIASAIVSFDTTDSSKLHIILKKNGKVVKHYEMLTYDTKIKTLKLIPIVKEEKEEVQTERIAPEKLTTFKIEVDQTDKLEKYKLKLPYMSKINEGESKIFYEPDAVDDWDEEDPDEDLDL